MFRLFNRNSIGAFLLLPVLLVLLRLRLIIHPAEGFIAQTEALYTPLWNGIFGQVEACSWVSILLSIVFTLYSAYMVMGIVNRYRFSERQSAISGMFFIVFTSGYVISQGLHPVHVFVMFMVTGIYRLFAGVEENNRPMRFCYEGAFMVSIGVLMWGKGLWFVPAFYIAMAMLRVFSLRSFLTATFGFLTPMLIASTWYFYNDQLIQVVETYWPTVTSRIEMCRTGMYTRTYLVLSAVFVAVGIVNALGEMPKLKIIESRYVRTVVWTIVVSLIFIFLPYFSLEMLNVVAVGGAVLVSAYMQRMRNERWQEIITVIFVVVTVFIQWKIKGT